MRARIRDRTLEAPVIDGRGYADLEAVVDALGGPAAILMTALGIPLTEQDGRLLVALRPLAERLQLPHQYNQADNTFYIDAEPLPPLPALPEEPVGASVRPWLPVTPVIAGGPGNRSPELLELIIKQFRVATNPRYRPNQQGRQETYCNIFVWDVTRALGCEIPHWVGAGGGPAPVGQGRELDANGIAAWLQEWGRDFGWRRVRDALALAEANAGRPAVAAWYNSGGIGHVAVVRPGQAHSIRGVPIAQAGARNFDDGYLADGFGDRGPIAFYVHD